MWLSMHNVVYRLYRICSQLQEAGEDFEVKVGVHHDLCADCREYERAG